MTLVSIYAVAELITRNYSWGINEADEKGWRPWHIHMLSVLKYGSLHFLEISGTVQASKDIPSSLRLIWVPNCFIQLQYGTYTVFTYKQSVLQ
jgi:hypothetical protein